MSGQAQRVLLTSSNSRTRNPRIHIARPGVAKAGGSPVPFCGRRGRFVIDPFDGEGADICSQCLEGERSHALGSTWPRLRLDELPVGLAETEVIGRALRFAAASSSSGLTDDERRLVQRVGDALAQRAVAR